MVSGQGEVRPGARRPLISSRGQFPPSAQEESEAPMNPLTPPHSGATLRTSRGGSAPPWGLGPARMGVWQGLCCRWEAPTTS